MNSNIHRNITINKFNMGITKSDLFTDSQNEIATIAKVLGHPARIAILEHLLSIEACVCGDLVQEIGLAQPTISQHLKELKNLKIIKGTISGTKSCYCIDKKEWQRITTILHQFLTHKNTATTCCN